MRLVLQLSASRAAAADEVRHARTMGTLAEAAGATAAPTQHKAQWQTRPLYALALENAIEGCVCETFAALMGMRTTRRCRDRDAARSHARSGRESFASHPDLLELPVRRPRGEGNVVSLPGACG